MQFIRYLKTGNWPALFGYVLFTGMMATGYYYNVTFVQLGLVDLGTRLAGMTERSVAMNMAVLAVLTCVISLAFGWLMRRRGWSRQFITKLRLAFAVIVLQTILTVVAPYIRSATMFQAWIIAASVALGVGVPVTFSMTVDLIPVRDRGYVAAIITAAAYFAAAVFSPTWTIEAFRARILWLMMAAVPGLGVLAFVRLGFMEALAQQHTRPEFAYGRFVRRDSPRRIPISRKLLTFIIVMFGIFFIDSLGFLRIIATPIYVDSAWLSPEWTPRLIIGGTHVVAALIAGILYSALDETGLFQWIFGIFALAHLTYTFPWQFAPAGSTNSLQPAILYAIAVSLYTVLNFAIWADISTPDTISVNAAFGVALSGWTATFISTALAIRWRLGDVPVDTHLRIVASVSMLFFLGLLLVSYLSGGSDAGHDVQAAEGGS